MGDAIAMLAQRRSLQFLRVTGVILNDDTLVEVFTRMQRTPTLEVYVEIQAEGSTQSAILNLLRHLDQEPVDCCANRALAFHLSAHLDVDRIELNLLLFNQIYKLVKSIGERHAPWLSYIHVGISKQKFGDKVIDLITSFDLLINARKSRITCESVEYEYKGEGSNRGGDFEVLRQTRRKAKPFEAWERSKR